MWDVMSKFTLAYFFKVQAWKQAHQDGLSGLEVVLLIVQALSYLALWISMTAVENSYKGIKFICLVSSLQMLIHLLSSIAQHVILVLNQNDVSNVLAGQDPTMDCTFGTGEYITSRILSFGAFIAVRLTCFQFFGFKRKSPYLAYCKDIKETVDALSFTPQNEIDRVKEQARAEEINGFGGLASPAGEIPAALNRLVSREEQLQRP